jgi:hypothetical protein
MTDLPTPLAAALGYAARGWRVVPIAEGRKVPAFPSWPERATTDPTTITEWFRCEYARCGVGIATGAASGIFVLDVDVNDGKAGDETLRDLEARHGALPDTYSVITGTGGAHYYFRVPDGVTIRNDAGRRLGPGLDIRGEGGQVLAPPTIHPVAGVPYETDAGATDEVAEAPAWLIDLLTAEVEVERRERVRASRSDRPGDRWAAATSWADLLTADGWTFAHVDRRANTAMWTRPGKQTRDGASASVGFGGSDVLKVFTTSLAHMGLQAEETYTKLGYLAATRFGSDHSAAASWLASQGWGETDEEAWAGLIAAHLDGAPDRAAVAELVADTLAQRPEAPTEPELDPWGDPQPLAREVELPTWPVEVLPDWMRQHVEAVCNQIQCPVDLGAQMALGAAAALCMGRAEVRVNGGWVVPLGLYLATAMEPGSGKSGVEKAMIAPLREYQRRRQAEQAPELAEADQRRRILARKLKTLEDAAASPGAGPDQLRDALDAGLELAKLDEGRPTPYRLLADDATPEALVSLLERHGQRLAIISSEAGLLDQAAGMYSNRVNIDIYLKAYSKDPLIRDRKGGGDRGPESIEIKPVLTVALCIQPQLLDRLRDPELRGRGFFDRFMLVAPKSLVGHRTYRHIVDGYDGPDHSGEYAEGIEALIRRLDVIPDETILDLTRSAREIYEAWQEHTERRLISRDDLGRVPGAKAKVADSLIRVAAILHLLHGRDHREDIDAETMAASVAVADYWLTHIAAIVVGTEDDDAQALADAQYILDKLAKEERTSFRQGEMSRWSRRFRQASDCLMPLAILTQRGWIRLAEGDWEDIGKQRRPVTFEVHPSHNATPRVALSPKRDTPRRVIATAEGLQNPYRHGDRHDQGVSERDNATNATPHRSGVFQTSPFSPPHTHSPGGVAFVALSPEDPTEGDEDTESVEIDDFF